MRFIPLKVSLTVAGLLGKLGFRLLKKHRDIALSNLDEVFSSNHQENEKIAEQVFVNFAKNGAEWIKLSSMDLKKMDKVVTSFENKEYLDEVMDAGKGAVVLGFHFGNWELLGFYLRHRGYPGAFIARRIYFHKYDKFLVKLRGRYDAKMIYRDESPKKMLRALKEGRAFGVFADQDVDSIDGIFVDFFGKKAYTPTAPVKLARAARTKIVPIFIIRNEDGTHKFVAEKPIDPSVGDGSEEDVKKYTQMWTDILEKYVRKYPGQWAWMHPRWKTTKKELQESKT